jgi:methylglutaconyl-CoA hydratase
MVKDLFLRRWRFALDAESLEMTREQDFEDATRLACMSKHRPYVGACHRYHSRSSHGGGAGLVCVCDFVIATQETQFSFSEVRLGIVPACIAPFVLRKIGTGHARALFTTAERFSAGHAYEIGMVHQIASDMEEAKSLAETKLKQISECGPDAVRYAKNLVFELLFCGSDQEQLQKAAELLATVRVSAEGQEGLRAFLEKRKPEWNK